MEEELQEEHFSGQEDRSLGKYGTALVSWEVDEYPHHERSRRWYLIAGAISLALIIYAIMTANFLFALIILMVDIIFILMIFYHFGKREESWPVKNLFLCFGSLNNLLVLKVRALSF